MGLFIHSIFCICVQNIHRVTMDILWEMEGTIGKLQKSVFDHLGGRGAFFRYTHVYTIRSSLILSRC